MKLYTMGLLPAAAAAGFLLPIGAFESASDGDAWIEGVGEELDCPATTSSWGVVGPNGGGFFASSLGFKGTDNGGERPLCPPDDDCNSVVSGTFSYPAGSTYSVSLELDGHWFGNIDFDRSVAGDIEIEDDVTAACRESQTLRILFSPTTSPDDADGEAGWKIECGDCPQPT